MLADEIRRVIEASPLPTRVNEIMKLTRPALHLRTGRIYGRVTSRRDTEKSCRPKVLCMVEGLLGHGEVARAEISEVIDSPGGMTRHSCRVLPGLQVGKEGNSNGGSSRR